MTDWLNKCHFGGALELLQHMPDGLVNTCVTSPPYFGLRDYGHTDQIGLESTPEEFIANLVSVFREVRRVLRDDGTLWVNIGDSYARTGGSDRGASRSATVGNTLRSLEAIPDRRQKAPLGFKEKDLIGIPWMLAFALRADGWYLRQDIIWAKPNPMPESVTDRCTKSHEYIFLLSKARDYYCDMTAIREAVAPSTIQRLGQNIAVQQGSDRVPGKTNGTMKAVGAPDKRNKRSVWTVATRPYKGAHFATFPPDLIEPCILAGAPAGGVVLDPFFGSGTTGQVARKLGRQFIGLELNAEYKPLQDERLRQPPLNLEAA